MTHVTGDPLFEASPTPMLVLSPAGAVLRLNDAARRMLGVRPERVLGKPVLAHVVPEDRARVRELFLRVLEGQRREWTARFRRADAATRVQWVRAVPAPDLGGILMFTRDITESREGRPETVQLQVLLENLPGQFTAVLDVQGRIRYASALARTHFRSDADAVGQPFAHLLVESAESRTLMGEMMERVLAGEHWSGTMRHRRVDDSPFPVRTFALPYLHPRDGRILGVLVAGRDATPEEELRARADRAERHAAIGRMVAGVVGVLRERLQAVVDGDEGAVAALESLLDRLAAWETLGTGPRQEISVDEVIFDVVSEVRRRQGAPGAPEVETGEGPWRVRGDRDGLRAVLMELLDNAWACAAEVGGPVRVRLDGGPSGVRVQITNPLPEAHADDVHRAFEPLFTTRPGRAGLGLTIARAVVEAHRGKLWMDRSGDTVVLVVEWPADPDHGSVRFRPAPLVLSRTRTVLVVDDEEDVRLSMRRFLERVGFEVREAWSGRSALAQITAGRPPEVVLTDLKMSDGSGQWFLQQLGRDFPELLRRTVVMTGAAHDPDVVEMVRSTGCPLVAKPVELPELLELIDELASRN